MTFPKRWLEDDDAAGAVRDVLRAGGAGVDPPEGAQDAVWLALASQIGAAGAAGVAASAKAAAGASVKVSAGAGAAAGSVASGGLLKAILVGALSGVVVMSGYTALTPSPPAAPPAPSAPQIAPAPPSASTPAGGRAAPAEPPAQEPPASPPPGAGADRAPGAIAPSISALAQGEATAAAPEVTAPAPAPGSPEERASRLREENELLGQARAALRSGDPGRAIAILEQARVKFPDGVLGQEREAVAIEALARSGAREAASARASAFLRAHPASPHAARLQVFVLP